MKLFCNRKIKYIVATAVMLFAFSFISYAGPSESATMDYYETEEYHQEYIAQLRQQIIDTALTYVGGVYRWGGSNPATGVDCSGFVMYIMQNIAGISLPHSSAAQSGYGREIGADELMPGDLAFYSNGGGINHVAIYEGDGMIVHASNSRDGIIVSNLYNGRSPVKFVRIME